LLLFSFLVMQAQTDTTVEEGIKVYTEPTDEDDSIDDAEEKKENFFLYKWEYDTLQIKQRRIPDGAVKDLKEDDDFWYANADAKKGERKTQPKREVKNGRQVEKGKGQADEIDADEPYVPLSRRSWFQTIMWIVIVAGFAGAIIWYLGGSNVGLFRKKDKKMAIEEENEISEDIFSINYQKEIDKAAAQGNYRLAIRLMYLRLLKNLSEKNIIQYKQDRTNLDYLLQLHPTAYYKDFFRITRHYEYSWYGEFNVSSDAYSIIRNEFDNFEKTTG
jgi:hypothetical protein